MIDVYDLAVIGGGPCGIASVVEAKRNGLAHVLLLEKGDNHSQTIRQFYKDKSASIKNIRALTARRAALFRLKPAQKRAC